MGTTAWRAGGPHRTLFCFTPFFSMVACLSSMKCWLSQHLAEVSHYGATAGRRQKQSPGWALSLAAFSLLFLKFSTD